MFASMHSSARNWHWEISQRYREAESLFQESSETKTTLTQVDRRLIANSMRLLADSRELLRKLDNFVPH